MSLSVTDLFCGAGGSSLGAAYAGLRLRMAANHWPKAIEVHQTNFPDAAHDCADISQVDPRRYPRTDLLLASPECTNHSSAKGVSRKRQDPSLFDSPDLGAERSRATMWDVHRFVEVHRYDAVIVENVVDAHRWVYWPSWWQAWDDAGYDARVVSLNSAHTGEVPQWRDRIYVVAWRRGIPEPDLELRPPSWCSACEKVVEGRQAWRPNRTVGKWRQQYDYVCRDCHGVVDPPAPPAASIIDWSDLGQRIGDRARPLAAKTLARIEAAIERYGAALVAAAGNTYERPGSEYVRAWPFTGPIPAQTTTNQHAVVTPPFLFQTGHGGRAHTLDQPHPTVCANDDRLSLIVPLRRNGKAHPSTGPIPTVAAGGNHHGLLFAPQSGGQGKPTTDPAPAMVAKTVPWLVTYNRTGNPKPVTEPIGAVTSKDRHALVDPAPNVEDCLFRMLEPDEVGRAMAFPDTYQVEGTKKDRVRLYGNAVTPPAMTWLTRQVLKALEAA